MGYVESFSIFSSLPCTIPSVPHHLIPISSAIFLAEAPFLARIRKFHSLVCTQIVESGNNPFAWKVTFLKLRSEEILNIFSNILSDVKFFDCKISLIILVSKDSRFAFISSYSFNVLSSLSASWVGVLIHNFSTVVSKISCISCILIATFGHTTAEILLTPEATASCPVIAKQPMSLVFVT
jgi:hypothetical protein